jgi:hypothetical protein
MPKQTTQGAAAMAGKGRILRVAVGVALAAAPVLLLAGPAAADTAQARAQGARVTTLGGPVAETGERVAIDDGLTGGQEVGSTNTGLPAGQTLITSGTFGQEARAGGDGTSAACAGAFGQGGGILDAPGDACVVVNGGPDGSLLVDLNQRGAFQATAVYAECTATSGGAPTGRTTLTDAVLSLYGFFNGGLHIPVVWNPDPPPNDVVDFEDSTSYAAITFNEQIPIPGGGLTVNAVHMTLPPNQAEGLPQADIVIGSVTCGPNADTDKVPIFAGPALPAAVVGAAAVLGTWFARRRRRVAA